VTAQSSSAAKATPVTFERLTVLPIPDPSPHVEILFPYAGKVVPMSKADAYQVRLRVEHWSGPVQIALDTHRPVVVSDHEQPVSLRALVPADQDLTPGVHRLFAVAVDQRGIMVRASGRRSRGPFSVVAFRVGSHEPLPAERPFIAYSQPRGTYNGDDAADSMLVDFYLVGLGRYLHGRVRVSVAGRDGTWSEVLDTWQPLAVRGLPSGDYVVELQMVGDSGQAIEGVATVGRTITVNRDAPVPNAPVGGG
jgi:hypothetical protein